MKPYLYKKGVSELVETLNGNERIHIGIRPYGFHAGNAISLVAYPNLLCKQFENKHNKKAEFTFIISLNDYEQDALDGPDYRVWPFNIYPKNTSIEMLTYENDEYVSDFWQDVIKSAVKYGLKNFPKVKIEFYKNSDLKEYPEFKNLLITTIKNPYELSDIFKKNSIFEILKEPLQYAGVVCPKCHKAHGKTLIQKQQIHWSCKDCGFETKGNYENFKYWWYHKPLLIARLLIYNIDITLSGGDHYSEGDFSIRNALCEKYAPNMKKPKMLFTPTVLSPVDGQKMSKSRDNHLYTDLKDFIKYTEKMNGGEFVLPDKLIKNVSKEDFKEYCCSL